MVQTEFCRKLGKTLSKKRLVLLADGVLHTIEHDVATDRAFIFGQKPHGLETAVVDFETNPNIFVRHDILLLVKKV